MLFLVPPSRGNQDVFNICFLMLSWKQSQDKHFVRYFFPLFFKLTCPELLILISTKANF